MKIERLAGIAGKAAIEEAYDRDYRVCQYTIGTHTVCVYGPVRETEQAAIRAWNAMVRRIRKANAAEEKP